MLNQSDATVSPTAGKRAAVPLPFWRYANRLLAKFTLPQTDTESAVDATAELGDKPIYVTRDAFYQLNAVAETKAIAQFPKTEVPENIESIVSRFGDRIFEKLERQDGRNVLEDDVLVLTVSRLRDDTNPSKIDLLTEKQFHSEKGRDLIE